MPEMRISLGTSASEGDQELQVERCKETDPGVEKREEMLERKGEGVRLSGSGPGSVQKQEVKFSMSRIHGKREEKGGEVVTQRHRGDNSCGMVVQQESTKVKSTADRRDRRRRRG
ncbi:predicted protein [Uncinocarpus reesii 1704]|uniref:Uncharacterized protein n=1 Tax=Uncinocarpus reesii (strain UAMH 1704) TaxID=336963 RepID=C4JJG5_UNCRE|nr:uncharacterized protein UREG_01772 [Uncinocarpus reesii 1704]EEP76923.1 predicted protein [Uncinocarpus reesii 1704]